MRRIIKIFTMLALSGMLFYSGCKNDNEVTPAEKSILPENFSVTIPDAISNSGGSNLRTQTDTLKGNGIYENLRTFIAVGQGGANIVQQLIASIAVYNINKPMSLSFESNDDQRTKNLVVVSNSDFEGTTWEFQMTITDSESEGNEDGGKAIEIFWNRSPIKGVAILKPYNINRGSDWGISQTALVRIDYSEGGEKGYDKQMIVTLAGLPLESPLKNPYSISGLKMFVGKKGNLVDVYGNSNHPNAVFFSGQVGFNWAFVASGNNTSDVAVAEVGLPPSSLDATSRTVLLDDYSIKNVFTSEIHSVWPNIPQSTLDAFLANTEAPGFFNHSGFVTGGTSPGSDYDALVPRIADLVPYNPKVISNLIITFK